MSSAIQEAWFNHLRPNLNPILFPRDFGLSRYPQVTSKKEYLTKVRWTEGDCYTSVYSQPQIDAGMIDTIFIDIDVERTVELPSVYKQVDSVLSSYSPARLYYSGSKGFHIYFDFPMVKRDLINRRGVEAFLKNIGLTNIDSSVLLDMRRMARIPYTINSKTDSFCLPISEDLVDFSFNKIKELAKELTIFGLTERNIRKIDIVPNNNVIREIAMLSSEIEEKTEKKGGNTTHIGETPWIERLLKKPVGDCRHRIVWLVLAPYLVNVKKLSEGDAKSRLIEYLNLCNAHVKMERDGENVEALADYFISYAKSTGLKPPRLDTLRTKYQDMYQQCI